MLPRLPRPACLPCLVALAACGGEPATPAPGATEPAATTPEAPAAPAAVGDSRARPDDPEGWTPIVAFEGEPVDTVRVRRDDGTLERITCHLAGQRGPGSQHGPDWQLFPNGLPRLRQVWDHGELEGPFTVLWPSGILRQEGTYRRGQRDGSFVQYFRTGDRHLEYTYADGVPQGVWYEWFVEGQLTSEERFRDGRRHGLCRRWVRRELPEGMVEDPSAEAVLLEEFEYVDGVLEGAWTDYWPSTGELRRTGRMENDLKVGLWRAHREDGSLKAEREFVAGVQEGRETLYDEEGNRIAENLYSDGVQQGLQRSWYSNGQLQSEGEMVAGLREGPWTYHQPDGTVHEEWTGTYREGQRIGD